MSYLVSKGYEGFGDRLQCLSHCINLASRFNRILCVDWNDRIWGESFQRYFRIVGLPTIDSVDGVPIDASVYPPFWSQALRLRVDEWIYKVKDEVLFDPTHVEPPAAVWVHCGIGFRSYDFNRLAFHLRLTEEVKELVRDCRAQSGLPVVHLRGTDRSIPNGRWEQLRAIAPIANVVSDDLGLADRWMSESPSSILMSRPAFSGPEPSHKRDGVDKFSFNVALIKEFLVVANAPKAYALNEESLFFTMSRLFGACGGATALFS